MKKITTPETDKTKGLATPNNIILLSNFIDGQDGKAIAKEIFGLLNETPEAIITHYIATKNFRISRDLTGKFFPRLRKDYEDREEYHGLIREAICSELKDIGNRDPEEFWMLYGEIEGLFLQLHLLFDEVKYKDLYLAYLHRRCMGLLEELNVNTDIIMIYMVKYFGEQRETGGTIKRPEFVLDVSSELIKRKVENAKIGEEENEDDDETFKYLVDKANKLLPESECLRDSEWLTIYYDEKDDIVKIKPNKKIRYHAS